MKRSVLLQSLDITPERRYRWINTFIKQQELSNRHFDETFTCVSCSCFHVEVRIVISDASVCKPSSAVTRSLIGCIEKLARFLLDATPVNLHSGADPVFISCLSSSALEHIHIFIYLLYVFASLWAHIICETTLKYLYFFYVYLFFIFTFKYLYIFLKN